MFDRNDILDCVRVVAFEESSVPSWFEELPQIFSGAEEVYSTVFNHYIIHRVEVESLTEEQQAILLTHTVK